MLVISSKFDQLAAEVQSISNKLSKLEFSFERLSAAKQDGISSGMQTEGENVFLQKFNSMENHQKRCEDALNKDHDRLKKLESTSYDGTLTLKISNYERQKRASKRSSTVFVSSQPFYMSRFGYQMKLQVYLNGYGQGLDTHISILLVIMKGDYDNILQWPFQEMVTLTMLDQGPGKCDHVDSFRFNSKNSSFSAPNSDIQLGSGSLLFISHQELEKSNFIKNDTMFIRVTVESKPS